MNLVGAGNNDTYTYVKSKEPQKLPEQIRHEDLVTKVEIERKALRKKAAKERIERLAVCEFNKGETLDGLSDDAIASMVIKRLLPGEFSGVNVRQILHPFLPSIPDYMIETRLIQIYRKKGSVVRSSLFAFFDALLKKGSLHHMKFNHVLMKEHILTPQKVDNQSDEKKLETRNAFRRTYLQYKNINIYISDDCKYSNIEIVTKNCIHGLVEVFATKGEHLRDFILKSTSSASRSSTASSSAPLLPMSDFLNRGADNVSLDSEDLSTSTDPKTSISDSIDDSKGLNSSTDPKTSNFDSIDPEDSSDETE